MKLKKEFHAKADFYEKEIQNLHTKMKEALLEAQNNCNLDIESFKEKEKYEDQIEELQFEKIKLENLIVKLKMDSIDEKVFLQEELRLNEEDLIVLKLKYAQSVLDIDKYRMKYKNLLKKT